MRDNRFARSMYFAWQSFRIGALGATFPQNSCIVYMYLFFLYFSTNDAPSMDHRFYV